jgi:hypothetical protein
MDAKSITIVRALEDNDIGELKVERCRQEIRNITDGDLL